MIFGTKQQALTPSPGDPDWAFGHGIPFDQVQVLQHRVAEMDAALKEERRPISTGMEPISTRVEAMAISLEAIATGGRPSLVGWRPSLLGWRRPSLLEGGHRYWVAIATGGRPSLVGWRPSLLGWRPWLLVWHLIACELGLVKHGQTHLRRFFLDFWTMPHSPSFQVHIKPLALSVEQRNRFRPMPMRKM